MQMQIQDVTPILGGCNIPLKCSGDTFVYVYTFFEPGWSWIKPGLNGECWKRYIEII
jgi:hypothetical protein